MLERQQCPEALLVLTKGGNELLHPLALTRTPTTTLEKEEGAKDDTATTPLARIFTDPMAQPVEGPSPLDVWEQKNIKAINFIMTYMTERLIVSMSHYERASEMWTALDRIYMQSTLWQRTLISLKIADFKYTGGKVSEFCHDLQMLYSEASCVGKEYPIADQIFHLLRCLPLTYGPVHIIWK